MKPALTSITSIGLACISWAIGGMAHAKDQELLAVLDRLACFPERIAATNLSPTLVIYKVTCKRSGRVLHITCLELECRQQAPSREEDER